MFIHVRVRFDCAELLGNIDSVLSKELAVRKIWIGIDANLRALEVFVEEIKHVYISWSKLSGVDFELVEHACSLVN